MKVAQIASICCLLVFFCSFQSFANEVSANSEQNADKLIQGTVLDSKGEPLVGASIMVKGTSIGTNADADGHFSLNAPEGAILLAQFMGYVDTEVKIGKQNT
ncbi:MAG: carboxypeptidase-like regulatory domain-containing protein [Bacteroidales bacterium]|jgi:protocatechuate 3,4-dioxygenase beta subunit|nr:carboxypeptidase-like regulatory domain-containing protein [Bacteroidales bacterium]